MDLDKDGNVYVADSNNFVIRKIAPDGSVTTMAGQAGKEGQPTEKQSRLALVFRPVSPLMAKATSMWLIR